METSNRTRKRESEQTQKIITLNGRPRLGLNLDVLEGQQLIKACIVESLVSQRLFESLFSLRQTTQGCYVPTMIATRLLSFLALTGLAMAWVKLDPALIPQVPAKLPVLALGTPSFIPEDILAGIASKTPLNSSTSTSRRQSDDPRNRLYGIYGPGGSENTDSGKTDYTDNLAKLDPHSRSNPIGPTSNPDGRDDTSGLARRHNDGDSIYLSLAVIQRSVEVYGHKIPTCGPSSQAVFGINADNRISTISFWWKEAKKNGQVCKAPSVDEVVKRIKDTLEAKHAKEGVASIKVHSVKACFYDSGSKFMQPVYQVLSEPCDPVTNQAVARGFLDYVPIGSEVFEPIDVSEATEAPQLPESASKPTGEGPVARSFLSYFGARQSRRSDKPTVTVGIYVVRNGFFGFVEDAWNFWLGLQSSSIINFVKKQYLFAQPWMFGWWANSFINTVDLALVEAHGNFHSFTTYGSNTNVDNVRIPQDIIAGGYGKLTNGGKGCLSYWIIDAGEVMPTQPDFQAIGVPPAQIVQKVYGPWRPIFEGGIHAIMSWRTAPLMSDNVAKHWAEVTADINYPVVTTWLFQASIDPTYTSNPTYTDRGTGKPGTPLGRAAAMFRCERPSDRVTDLDKVDKSTCVSVRYWT
ncbi:hypothetical protein NMY22_g10865 [Coprinellus aureogranulatus]|nr:hypothetical protein NMY22_g10865 [Coprinellus aureogranulatus]